MCDSQGHQQSPSSVSLCIPQGWKKEGARLQSATTGDQALCCSSSQGHRAAEGRAPPPPLVAGKVIIFQTVPQTLRGGSLVLPGASVTPPPPPGGQVAQLYKNLGHFVLCHKALPRALASSALDWPGPQTHRGTWLALCSSDVEVPLAALGPVDDCTLSSGSW